MQKPLTTLLCCFILLQSFGQSQRKVSVYLSTQYNHTLYDYTIGNNSFGFGLGLQTFFNNKTKFKPTLELTGDVFGGTKQLYLNPDGSIPENENWVSSMVNLFVGSSFHPTKKIYLSFVAGPSFISGKTLFAIKPSFGFYFSETQRWTGKVSFINVFNRTEITNDDFGSLSFAIGLRLF